MEDDVVRRICYWRELYGFWQQLRMDGRQAGVRLSDAACSYFLLLVRRARGMLVANVQRVAHKRQRAAVQHLDEQEIFGWLYATHWRQPASQAGQWQVGRFLLKWESQCARHEPDSLVPSQRQLWLDATQPYLVTGLRGRAESWVPAVRAALEAMPGGLAELQSVISQSETIFITQFGRKGCVAWHYVSTLPSAALAAEDPAAADGYERLQQEPEQALAECWVSFLDRWDEQLRRSLDPKLFHKALCPELAQLWSAVPSDPERAVGARGLAFSHMSCPVSWRVFYQPGQRCFHQPHRQVYPLVAALEVAAAACIEAAPVAKQPLQRSAWRHTLRSALVGSASQLQQKPLRTVLGILRPLWLPAELSDQAHTLAQRYWSTADTPEQAAARMRLMLRHGGNERRGTTAEPVRALAALDELLATHMAGLTDPELPQWKQKEHVGLLDRMLRRGIADAMMGICTDRSDAVLEKLGQALFADLRARPLKRLPRPADSPLGEEFDHLLGPPISVPRPAAAQPAS